MTLTTQNRHRRFPLCSLLLAVSSRAFVVSPSSAWGRGQQSQQSTKKTTAASLALSSTSSTTTTMAAPPPTLSASDKVAALRKRMQELELDVWLVPSDDPHLSEYVPDAYARRSYLTSFDGSAGTAIVSDSAALLWTDSRYWNQAGLQLDDSVWTLQKQSFGDTPTVPAWLAQQAVAAAKAEKKFRIGLDPLVHPGSFAKDIREAVQEQLRKEGLTNKVADDVGVVVADPERNLVDEIWGASRPPLPTSPFRVHPLEYAGVTVTDKVAAIRTEMKEKNATMAVFCTLDDVAYLLNVRCQGDIDTCPVGIAYATVTSDEVTIYCEESKFAAVAEKEKFVTVAPYESVVTAIESHCQESPEKHRVWLDAGRSNYALVQAVPSEQLVDAQTAVVPMKACKNEAELAGMREAHVVDGVAMAKFITWLRKTLTERSVSEVEIDQVLTGYRAEQKGFVEVSFPTIAGVASNGAIVHYRAEEGSDLLKHLDLKEPILIDSGGQYLYGTTDVTRTWHFGTASDEFRDAYTRVLKGHIGVDQMIFPEGTPGFVLDVYARQWLWRAGMDYGHGTGHGVGAALNVHEGPMSISPRWANKEGLKAGMVVSNEPGFYEDGKFGVRIENLLEIQMVNGTDEKGESDGKKKFLKFGRLTQIPIQKSLIKTELMTETELDWLDSYHHEVWEKVSPRLDARSPEFSWLEESCSKIDR